MIHNKSAFINYFFITVIIFVLIGVFLPTIFHMFATPQNTFYSLADGYTFDYYQYMSWIKQGMDGHLLLTSPYTEIPYPRVLIHPFFPILGIIAGLFSVSPFIAYAFSRITATVFFIFVFYILTSKSLNLPSARFISLFLFLTSTGFWTISYDKNIYSLVEPISWSQSFNVIGKFSLPPHHLLALSFSIITYLLLIKKRKRILDPSLSILLGILTGFLNPSTLLFTDVILFCTLLPLFLIYRDKFKWFISKSLLFLTFTSPVLLYHFYLFNHFLPWSLMYKLMQSFNPSVSLVSYLLSLGPVFPLALYAIITKKTSSSPLHLLLSFWTILPVILFLFRSVLPVNNSRIFQSYQYIPMTIVAAIGLQSLTLKLARFKIKRKVIIFLFLSFFGIFAFLPYVMTINKSVRVISTNFYNIYLPKTLLGAFDRLEKQAPRGSVVLAGEYVSSMIPVFTNNRTILGREDSAPDYFQKQTESYTFLDGLMGEKETWEFLQKYSISYILSGVDTIPYETLRIKSYPFLTEIYRNQNVSVLQVRLENIVNY